MVVAGFLFDFFLVSQCPGMAIGAPSCLVCSILLLK